MFFGSGAFILGNLHMSLMILTDLFLSVSSSPRGESYESPETRLKRMAELAEHNVSPCVANSQLIIE